MEGSIEQRGDEHEIETGRTVGASEARPINIRACADISCDTKWALFVHGRRRHFDG